MKLAWRVAEIVALAAAIVCFGCGRKAANPPAKPAAEKSAVLLPEWAPKNPSPEFLRAARVIKPWPGEVTVARDKGDVIGRAWSEKYGRTLAAAWGFFGTLTDQQIEHFVKTKKLRLLVKDLNPKQRSAMYHYFDVWRESMKGVPVDLQDQFGEDWLVDLYKLGAKQDLSNVEITFDVRSSHRVRMMMQVQLPGGKLSAPCPAGIGQL